MTAAHHEPHDPSAPQEPDAHERTLDARLAAVTSALAARSVDPQSLTMTSDPVTARLMRDWLDLYEERLAYTARRYGRAPGTGSAVPAS